MLRFRPVAALLALALMPVVSEAADDVGALRAELDRKSTRLNSSHLGISYAVFCLKKKKIMDELAQCYTVLPQLDINNTIDHRPEGDEKRIIENERTVTQFSRKQAAERPHKDICGN